MSKSTLKGPNCLNYSSSITYPLKYVREQSNVLVIYPFTFLSFQIIFLFPLLYSANPFSNCNGSIVFYPLVSVPRYPPIADPILFILPCIPVYTT